MRKRGVMATAMFVMLVVCGLLIAPLGAQNKSVLVLSNRDADFVASDFGSKMTGLTFSSWDADTTPSLSYLQTFDVVLLFENSTFSNTPNVGDVVYSYVMGGGNLVIGTFYEQDRSDITKYTPNGWGNLETIDVFATDTQGCKYAADSMNTSTIVSHPIMNGVSSLWFNNYGGGNAVKSGTTVLAYLTNPNYLGNPDPLVGYRIVGSSRLVHIGIFPAYEDYGNINADFGGDFYMLWENALCWAAGGCAIEERETQPIQRRANSPSILPLANTNLSQTHDLMTQADDLLSQAKAKNLDTVACMKTLDEAKSLYELARKFKNSPVTANYFALKSQEKFKQAIDCLKALLG